MTNENDIKLDEVDETQLPADKNENQEEEKFDKAYLEKTIKMRLKQEQDRYSKEIATLKAKNQELEKKIKDGTATPNEKIQHQTMQNTAEHAANAGVPYEDIPSLVEEQRKSIEMQYKLDEAMEKDPEFKKLAQTGNPIPAVAIEAMKHLDNAPAVIKHLLKDKNDHRLMQLKAANGIVDFTEFVNDLSSKIAADMNKNGKPRPPNFTPAPDLSNVGESDQDFDITDYVKSNKRFR